MESFLNILWVAMALVALGVWRTIWLHERREARRDPLREWTAFACALVLLFFAVSLTDDLHSELIIFDECSASSRHASGLVGAHDTSGKTKVMAACSAAILPAALLAPSSHRLEMIVPVPEISGFQLVAYATSGRAPPSLAP